MNAGDATRPDVDAEPGDGDLTHSLPGESRLDGSELDQARFWHRTYAEILAKEERVMERIQELMASQPVEVRQEVELSDLPVVAAQIARFRHRHALWAARVAELEQ